MAARPGIPTMSSQPGRSPQTTMLASTGMACGEIDDGGGFADADGFNAVHQKEKGRAVEQADHAAAKQHRQHEVGTWAKTDPPHKDNGGSNVIACGDGVNVCAMILGQAERMEKCRHAENRKQNGNGFNQTVP